ncbi:LamG-like jellyroll fold domain-containing protein, partial [Planctomycetota bacterium]
MLRKARRFGPTFETLEKRHLLAADLIVSEFVARNSNTLDADGESSDWIEVFNQGATAADLEDWYLTDDANDLNKWRFPPRGVEPGEAITVFASGKNRQGAELHTNFRLSGSGEYLALIEPDAVTIATEFSPTYPPQIDDVSYGVPMEHVIDASAGNETRSIDATLVSHFTFDNSSKLGDDVGAFDNDATTAGNARFSAASKIGAGALFLDGDGDFLEIPNSGADYASIANDGDGFTFAAWVNVDSAVDGNRRLFSMDMEETTFKPRGWGVGLREENTLLATTYGRVDFDEPSGGAIGDGDWRHLAYVFNPAQGSVEFFIDGVSTGTETDTPVGVANSLANDDYLIGALNLTSSRNGQFFRGLMDDIRIYDEPLSQSDVRSIMSPSADAGSFVRYLVPQNGAVDSNWMKNNFNDSSWSKGPAAIGYQNDPAGIGGIIKQTVPQGTRSVYLRKSFEIEDVNDVSTLLLRMKYDDGFVAYLNGSVVATSNAPDSLRFDSLATTDRDNSLAREWTAIDLSRS